MWFWSGIEYFFFLLIYRGLLTFLFFFIQYGNLFTYFLISFYKNDSITGIFDQSVLLFCGPKFIILVLQESWKSIWIFFLIQEILESWSDALRKGTCWLKFLSVPVKSTEPREISLYITLNKR